MTSACAHSRCFGIAPSLHHRTRDDGGYVMIDVGARAGVLVREPGSRLKRVYQVRLVVGMHVRLGSVSLLVTDAYGR